MPKMESAPGNGKAVSRAGAQIEICKTTKSVRRPSRPPPSGERNCSDVIETHACTVLVAYIDAQIKIAMRRGAVRPMAPHSVRVLPAAKPRGRGDAGQGKVRHLLQVLRRGAACSRGAVQAGRAGDCLFAIWETTPERAGSAHHPATACRKNFARFFVRCDKGFCIDKLRPLLYSENR